MCSFSIKHLFGIKTSLSNSLIYLNEYCYIYPSYRNVILYNIDYKCQYLINYENEFDKLECLSLSLNKEYLAIGLNQLNKCRIIIYNLKDNLKNPIKEKILLLKQSINCNHIISIIFSNNSKYLLALYGEPDYILVCWSIQRNSIQQFKSIGILSIHINHSYNPLNLQISFNPNDSSQIILTGNHIFEQYRLNNGRLSQYKQDEFEQYQSINITCHCWINENHILLGLDYGFIYIINKHGQIIQKYNLTNLDESNNNSFVNIKNGENLSKMQSISKLSSRLMLNKKSLSTTNLDQYSNSTFHNNQNQISCLLPFSRGLFVSTANGCIFMFERSENNIDLTYLRKFILPSSLINNLFHQNLRRNPAKSAPIRSMENIFLSDLSFKNQRSTTNEIIHSLALSPNEEILLAATNYNHLYEITFSKMDYRKKEENIFTYALNNSHNGSITTGTLCIRKSLLFTIGIDHYLKIWNLQTNTQELNHQFDNEPLLLSVHPSRYFVCISFSNILIIYTYTIDGLILFKQFQISHIECIEYSNEGHILAVGYSNILQFYNHKNYDEIISERINEKKFRLIRWAHDDSFLLSIDFNDFIIQWNPYTGQRLSQYRIEDFSIEDLILTSDNKLAYLLTSDKKIKEFVLMTNIRDINIPFNDCIPTTLAINNKTRSLFIGSQNGSIYSFKLTQTSSVIDTNHLNYVHQGAILISINDDLFISMGEDGNVIIYNLNDYQQNKESKIIYRDEILAKEILLKQQNIELNYLLERQIEIKDEYENKIEIKDKEYIEHLDQLDVHCQSIINEMNIKIKDLQQKKFHLQNQHEQQLNLLNENKQNNMDVYIDDKSKYYKEILDRNQFIKSKIENFKTNNNFKIQLTNDLYQRNIELIHLSYRDKINNIKNKFSQDRQCINERINDLEEIKLMSNENAEIELRNIHEYYLSKLRTIVDKIEKLENEEILLKIRLEQLEEESNRYENQMKEYSIERNKLIDSIKQIDNDLNLAKQTFQQRHFIIQEKLKRTNEMENRGEELEKFAYVFNYKIRELTSQIGPRQYEVQALIEQFNNMDNEYDLLNQNNEKYSIKIADYKARLKAIEKDLQKQTFLIRKLNETSANIKEDLKLCCHLIDQPKQITKIIRQIYGKYILNIHTNMNFGQLNIFDCDRQRAHFERANQRLQTKISLDIKKEKLEDIHRIKEQINIMREISSYCLKVVEVERILSDLDIVSTIVNQNKITTSNDIIHALKLEQNSNFIQQKQNEFNSISNKQQKRIEYLRNFIQRLEEQLRQTSDPCETQLIFNLHSNSSIDQSRIFSTNSVHS
ncbi:unnamed protein product [Adineta steineri]|uniref:WD repeat-containing protein 65 n=2 Tax=Adineta steineri TaxID=433720 RepID=A0A814QRS2_9BILA|nr:unnamed protein product [Adineta steineri]